MTAVAGMGPNTGQNYVQVLYPPARSINNLINTAADGIAVADFDLDGSLDFVVGNSVDNTVRLYYQQSASPFFKPGGTWGVGRLPRAVASADVDGDGRPDIVVANHDSNTISVMLNRSLP